MGLDAPKLQPNKLLAFIVLTSFQPLLTTMVPALAQHRQGVTVEYRHDDGNNMLPARAASKRLNSKMCTQVTVMEEHAVLLSE